MHSLRLRPISSLSLPTLAGLLVATACAPGADVSTTIPKFEYPQTKTVEVSDDYHGTEVADPYRWLEDLDGEETAAWVAEQNEISRPYLASLPARDEIKERLTAIWDHERYSSPFKEGDDYFYFRNDGLQNQSVLYRTASPEEDGEVVLDPNAFSEDGTVSLAGLSISPGARYIAFARSDGGSDWDTWSVLDLETLTELDDSVGFTKFTSASWTKDESGFYYSRYPEGESGEGDDQQNVTVYFHKVGTPQSEDEQVYAETEYDKRNPYGFVTDDGRFLILSIQEGYLQNAVYYRRLDQANSPVVRLLDDWDALYNFIGNVGDTFYFQTTLDAPKGRVLAIDLDKPARSDWRDILAEQEEPLQGTGLVGGHLVANYLQDVKSRVRLFTPDGEPVRDVELPGIGSAGGFGGKWDDTETFYSFSSFTVPSSIYRYDIATGETTLFRQPDIDLDLGGYTTEQVFFESKDGTRIPMFITHKSDLEKNGDNPTLLYGYGGFNVSLTPGFSLSRMVWLERGGVLAIPNLRGGGEYGREWHLAGTKLQKQNVFDDFIGAAEWLIDNGYTKAGKLAIQGGSNGGLLVGAALTQRPELFGATLPAVGVLDMLRYHLPSANARNWGTDYGLSENEDEFKAQLAYSPLHNVDSGTCYPPTLVTTADHDDRVVPWHSFKFGATLQAGQGCDNPILLRVETRAGHGAGTPTWMQIENIADQYAFVEQMLNRG
ncbi:MAG: prolyl oligopeptidase family serine peptidase [Acidobacteriota bacterium]